MTKFISGFEGLYSASSDGHIYSHHAGIHQLKPWVHQNGYLCVSLSKNGKVTKYKVHRIIAETLIHNAENKPFVNHKNGLKTDNAVNNLEWCTSSENNTHAFRTGLRVMPKGKSHVFSKMVIDTSTGQIFACSREASEASGIKKNTLMSYLLGTRKNTTTLKFLE